MREFIERQRLKVGVWLRERKERAAEKKAAKRAERGQGSHDSHFWLLSVPATATLLAAFVEVYWAMLFCIEATGTLDMGFQTALGSTQAAASDWHFGFIVRSAPVLIGLLAATIPIVMWSMVWLPVQMKARGSGRWRRTTMIVTGLLANALVIVSGTVVMNYNRQEQVRAQTVVEQTADAQRSMLNSNVQDLKDELDTLMNHRSTYVATAASVGAVAYERDYVVQARRSNDPRLPLLERALGSAHRADELREQIRQARQTVAQANPQAATQAHVEDRVGVGLNTFASYAEVYRPPFVALLCTLVGIFGAWWWVALSERMNPIETSGWADEGHRIEDQRAEGPLPIDPEGLRPPREEIYDAETGEKLVKVKGAKEHFRRAGGKKGKAQKIVIAPEIPPDETGVSIDGGDRQAVSKEALTDDQVSEAAEHHAEEKNPADLPEPVEEPIIFQPEPSIDEQFPVSDDDYKLFEQGEPLFAEERDPDKGEEDERQGDDGNGLDEHVDHQPEPPQSTALTLPGYVFDDEQHDAHVRDREMADAK